MSSSLSGFWKTYFTRLKAGLQLFFNSNGTHPKEKRSKNPARMGVNAHANLRKPAEADLASQPTLVGFGYAARTLTSVRAK